MNHSPAADDLAAYAGRAGLVLDFDGVLAPIVDQPEDSRLLPGTAEVLERLAGRLAVVAVVSGRPTSFLGDHVAASGVRLIGSYGLEEDPSVAEWLPRVEAAITTLTRLFPVNGSGIAVERKAVSVAVHWRLATDRSHAEERVIAAVREIGDDTGLRVEPGKCVLELLPPVTVDKGTVVERIVAERQLSTLAYAGDDKGDLPALRAAISAGGHALVVDHGPETRAELRAIASETFDGVEALAAWLAGLAERLDS
jgi:trehalose 6-phosphate phosphatase